MWLVNSHGIDTPSIASFRLPVWCHWRQNWDELCRVRSQSRCRLAPARHRLCFFSQKGSWYFPHSEHWSTLLNYFLCTCPSRVDLLTPESIVSVRQFPQNFRPSEVWTYRVVSVLFGALVELRVSELKFAEGSREACACFLCHGWVILSPVCLSHFRGNCRLTPRSWKPRSWCTQSAPRNTGSRLCSLRRKLVIFFLYLNH